MTFELDSPWSLLTFIVFYVVRLQSEHRMLLRSTEESHTAKESKWWQNFSFWWSCTMAWWLIIPLHRNVFANYATPSLISMTDICSGWRWRCSEQQSLFCFAVDSKQTVLASTNTSHASLARILTMCQQWIRIS